MVRKKRKPLAFEHICYSPGSLQYFAKQDKSYLRQSIFQQGLDQIITNVFNLIDLLEFITPYLSRKPVFNELAWVDRIIKEYSNNKKQISKSVSSLVFSIWFQISG